MAELVGEAADDDEQFWNADIWNEDEDGSDAESFVEEEEEVKPDEFDSDFNDTETEEESGSDDEGNMRKTARAQMVKQSKSSNVYKDPTAVSGARPAPKRQLVDGEEAPPRKRRIDPSMVHTGPLERTVRNSTKAKTMDAEETEKERLKLQNKANRAKSVDRVIKTQHIQKDLLLEALDTEETNNKWLIAQSVVENERAQADKPVKKATDESFIRHASRRGTYNTVTFSMVEAMPAILRDTPAPFDAAAHKKSQTCVVTGLPAKYRDPLTMLPYATLDAFREIRRRYPNSNKSGSMAGVSARNVGRVL
eukprot:gene20203-22956_t